MKRITSGVFKMFKRNWKKVLIISGIIILTFFIVIHVEKKLTQQMTKINLGLELLPDKQMVTGNFHFGVGQTIRMKLNNVNQHDFKFRLQEKINSQDWVPVSDYSNKLPIYTFHDKGIISLHIDIINSHNPKDHQGIWIGQFFINSTPYKPNMVISTDSLSGNTNLPSEFQRFVQNNHLNMLVSQFVFYMLLFLVGFIILLVFKEQLGTMNICLMSFPFGAAIWALSSLFILILEIPYNLLSIELTLLLLMVISLIISRKNAKFSQKDLLIISISSLVFILVSLITVNYNYAITSYDSIFYVQLGKIITAYGLTPPRLIDSYGLFIPTIHSAGVFLGFDFAYGFLPLLSFSFLCLFFWFLFQHLRQSNVGRLLSIVVSIIATSVMASTFFYIFQSFWIGSNFVSGVFLFLAMITALKAFSTNSQKLMILSFIAAAAFTMARVESPIFIAVFLTALIALGFSFRVMVSYMIGYLTLIFFWYLKLTFLLGLVFTGDFWTVPRAILIMIILISMSVYVILSRKGFFQKLTPYVSVIMLYLLAFAFIALVFYKPEFAVTNFSVLIKNMFLTGLWGISWVIIALIFIISLFLKPINNESFYITTIVGFLLLLFITFMFRSIPLRLGFGDSGNRMLIHIFPMIVFYLFLKLGVNYQRSCLEDRKI